MNPEKQSKTRVISGPAPEDTVFQSLRWSGDCGVYLIFQQNPHHFVFS